MARGFEDLFGPSFLDDPFVPRRVPHPGPHRGVPVRGMRRVPVPPAPVRRVPAPPPRHPVERGARRVPVDPTIAEPPSLTDFDVPIDRDDGERIERRLRDEPARPRLRTIDGGHPERGPVDDDDRAEDLARGALARAEAKHSFDQELSRAKHRFEREAEREVSRQRREIITPFLEVLDDMDRALAASDDASDGLREGVVMIRERFLAKLRDQGVTPMEVDGTPFDPERHEAMSVVPVSDPSLDNTVVGVIRAGYALGDDVLRPAGVAVGRIR